MEWRGGVEEGEEGAQEEDEEEVLVGTGWGGGWVGGWVGGGGGSGWNELLWVGIGWVGGWVGRTCVQQWMRRELWLVYRRGERGGGHLSLLCAVCLWVGG